MLYGTVDDKSRAELVPESKDPKFKLLDDKLLDKGLVVYYKGDMYMFLFASNTWANMSSEEAQTQLNSVVGITNVSTNYSTSSKPFISYLEKNAQKVRYIPLSMCVDTRRLGVKVSKTELVTYEPNNIVDIPEEHNIDPIVSGLTIAPCIFGMIPRKWTDEGSTLIDGFISPLFTDERELTTFKWLLGGVPLDPVQQSKFLILYGVGGTGKTTMLTLIDFMFRGCVGAIPSGVFTSTLPDAPRETLVEATSRRVVTCGEIDLLNRKLNIHIVKSLTGGDRVSIGAVRAATRSTIICAANSLPEIGSDSEWYTTQVQRRAIVQPFGTNAVEMAKVEIPDSDEDLMDFTLSCVHTRLRHSQMPVTLRMLLLSLLRGSYFRICDFVEECKSPSMKDTIEANVLIEQTLDLESGTLGNMAWYISSLSVITYDDVKYIKNMRLVVDFQVVVDV